MCFVSSYIEFIYFLYLWQLLTLIDNILRILLGLEFKITSIRWDLQYYKVYIVILLKQLLPSMVSLTHGYIQV